MRTDLQSLRGKYLDAVKKGSALNAELEKAYQEIENSRKIIERMYSK